MKGILLSQILSVESATKIQLNNCTGRGGLEREVEGKGGEDVSLEGSGGGEGAPSLPDTSS